MTKLAPIDSSYHCPYKQYREIYWYTCKLTGKDCKADSGFPDDCQLRDAE